MKEWYENSDPHIN